MFKYTGAKIISANTTNSTLVKNTSGSIGYLIVTNTNAAIRWLKCYSKVTAPTVGTDVPFHTFGIPANTAGAGFAIPLPSEGIQFAAGIGLAITTGYADNDTGVVAAGEIVVNYGYR